MGEPRVLFEDQDMLILDKPAGMIVNSADTTKSEVTVQDWIKSKISDFNSPTGEQISNDREHDFYKRNGIIHRLDKETSGILLSAKTLAAFEELQRQFKERIVKKTYTALAHGEILPAVGEIRVPVGRLPFNRKRFGVIAGGKEAVTKYKVYSIKYIVFGKKKELLSLVELYPETGRTHQIRVHLKYMGHPIVADDLYAGRKTAREDRRLLPRLFLHASKITFVHPKTKKEISFISNLPNELENFLHQLSEST